MDEAKTSAAYYLFEDVLWQTTSFAHLRRRRSLHELQLLAGLVWAGERGRGACPIVRPRPGDDYSFYCYREHVVHLICMHRNIGGVLHELAHALGRGRDKLLHGPAFRSRALRLYRIYGDWNGQLD